MDDYADYTRVAKIPRGLKEKNIQISYHVPTISKKDIELGYVERYFAQQTNQSDGEIIEINRQTYQKIKDIAFYRTVSVTWRITGALEDIPGPDSIHGPKNIYTGVITSNRVAVEEADRQLRGMINRLRVFTQFWVEN